ncbi:MAG TPA: helix-turn-helix transcriptional regulator [Vicinamibacterales bacterium]|nr:helix-turn-helix transcriptional regulator [Vicinamibacterales bacterium]
MTRSKGGSGMESGGVLQITPSERQAIQLIAQGMATSRIGATLGLSATDVEPYLAALFAKFGATSRGDAIAAAARRGLLVPSSTDDVRGVVGCEVSDDN